MNKLDSLHNLVDKQQIDIANLLIERLGRLSVDSTWAHRASGTRGSLIKYTHKMENDACLLPYEQEQFSDLIKTGFDILTNAAREIAGMDGDKSK